MHERDAQRESLTPARRESPRQCGVMPAQADQFQRPRDAGFVGDPIDAAVKRQIFQHGQVIIDCKFLRHVSRARSHLFALFERVESQHGRVAVAGFEQSEQHADRRRLARSVRTEIADDFARAHFKVDVIHCDEFAEAPREIFNLDDRITHGSTPTAR